MRFLPSSSCQARKKKLTESLARAGEGQYSEMDLQREINLWGERGRRREMRWVWLGSKRNLYLLLCHAPSISLLYSFLKECTLGREGISSDRLHEMGAPCWRVEQKDRYRDKKRRFWTQVMVINTRTRNIERKWDLDQHLRSSKRFWLSLAWRPLARNLDLVINDFRCQFCCL